MPVTKPVVFISSTAADLRLHRDAAARAAHQAGFEPVIMEDFEAQSLTPPYPACMDKVAECDVLMVIVAHRYGWVPADQPDGGAKSITWLECEQILKCKKEVLAFVVKSDHAWPAESKEAYRATDAFEKDTFTPELPAEISRNVKQLGEFKSWLNGLGFRRTFTTPESLNSEVQEQLVKWLKRHPDFHAAAPNPNGADPTEYLRQLREQTRWMDIRGLQVGSGKAHRFPIDELYIPLTSPGGDRGTPLADVLREPRLVIEGDPGAGKTTFLRRIAYEMCRDDGRAGMQFQLPVTAGYPLYVRVADLEEHIANCRNQREPGAPPNDHSPLWLVHYFETRSVAQGWNLSADFFRSRLGSAGTTLLLDGLDEAPDRRRRESLARLLEEATAAFQACRFVVTTRPQSYSGKAKLDGFREVRVGDLAPDDIETFLRHWSQCLFPDDALGADAHFQALSEALNARPAIRKMARNPVMLTALAVVHWNERRLPEQRADLYESICTWLARARESRPGRESADRVLALLGHLALGMQLTDGGRVAQISRATAAEILAPQFRDESGEDLRLGRARAFLDAEEGDSGIFVSRGADLRFWHLTLQEFLAARTIAGLADASQQKLLFEGGRLHRAEWREAMLLLGGTLIKQGTDKVDGLFGAMLKRVSDNAGLAEKATAVGLIGAMLADLRPLAYNLPDDRYGRMLTEVLGIFDAEKSQGIPLKVRLEAADALGQAGDPRLRLPRDKDYWVEVPAGRFVMGEGEHENEPPHEVWLDAFLIGRYPVTVYEYARFLEDSEYQPPPDWEKQAQHPNRPVVRVSWHDAEAYCRWAGVRLPTEAEWERAQRGTEGRRYPWGDDPPAVDRANFGNAVGHASPVGLFPAGSTPEGVADLAGNVWEWCADWYDKSYYRKATASSPKGPESGESKCLRGGSWNFVDTLLRAAYRHRFLPDSRSVGFGFRCAREVFP